MSTLPYPHGTGTGQIGENADISTTPLPGTSNGMMLGHGEELTSAALNRSAYAVDENVDHIWSRMKSDTHPLAIRHSQSFSSTGDDGVQLTGDVYVGNTGTSSPDDIILLLDGSGQVLQVGGVDVHVTDIRDVDGGISIFKAGFHSGAWLDFDQTIPSGTSFTVVYGVKSDLDELPDDALLTIVRPTGSSSPPSTGGVQMFATLQEGIAGVADGEVFAIKRSSPDPSDVLWTISGSGNLWGMDGRYAVIDKTLVDLTDGSVVNTESLSPQFAAGVFTNLDGWVHWYQYSGTIYLRVQGDATQYSLANPEPGVSLYAADFDGKNLVVFYKNSDGDLSRALYPMYPHIDTNPASYGVVSDYSGTSISVTNYIKRARCVGRWILIDIFASNSNNYVYAIDRAFDYGIGHFIFQVYGPSAEFGSYDGKNAVIFYTDTNSNEDHVAVARLGMYNNANSLVITDNVLSNRNFGPGFPSVGADGVWYPVQRAPAVPIPADSFPLIVSSTGGMDHFKGPFTNENNEWYTDGVNVYWYDELNGEWNKLNGPEQGSGLWRKTPSGIYLPHHPGWQAIPV